MADQAFATNPANVKPEFFVVLRHELTSLVVITIFGSIIFLPLGWFVWKWLWLGLLLIPVGYWAVFYGTGRVMRLGACCPAKVLSLDPPDSQSLPTCRCVTMQVILPLSSKNSLQSM